MFRLDQLQHRMCSAIRGRHEPELVALIEPDGIAPEARMRVYRNNTTQSLIEALKATYPVVCRLVDERFFSYAVHEYIGQAPPSRPCLAEYGESFPDFLAAFAACRDLVYLADVARLEWAIHSALHAEEATPAVRPASGSPDLVLALHPSSRLIVSRWPIERIWRANQPDGEVETIINVDTGGAWLQVYRRGDRVIIRGIEDGSYAFLHAITQGAQLQEATAAARRVAPLFDAAADLNFLFEEGLIVQLASATPPFDRS